MPAAEIRESKIERDSREYAMSRGWFVEKIMRTGRNGFPDRFFARDGRIVLIEFKRQGKDATSQQLKRHRELREHGVEVLVIDSFDKIREVLW